jgi:hypothetical protein
MNPAYSIRITTPCSRIVEKFSIWFWGLAQILGLGINRQHDHEHSSYHEVILKSQSLEIVTPNNPWYMSYKYLNEWSSVKHKESPRTWHGMAPQGFAICKDHDYSSDCEVVVK